MTADDRLRVLILCTGNSARSQMAAAMVNHFLGPRVRAESAGTEPAARVHPQAVAAMREIGIDISSERPKPVDVFAGQAFDLVLTVCDHAAETCPLWPGQGRRVHIGFPDPAAAAPAEQAASFRAVRDAIRTKLLALVEEEIQDRFAQSRHAQHPQSESEAARTFLSDTQSSYDRVAAEYARRIFDELQYKPLDREWLDRFAERVRGRGPVCDMGCGPGQVARYLHERGVDAFGIDLSPAMLAQARALSPGIRFRPGNMLALDAPDDAWAGIAAFYSLIHVPRALVPVALREFKRVLQPDGVLLLAFHIGRHTQHLDEWWGQPVCVDFEFFEPGEIAARLAAAGFQVEELAEREPYPEVEHQSRRAYISARA